MHTYGFIADCRLLADFTCSGTLNFRNGEPAPDGLLDFLPGMVPNLNG